MSKQNHRYRVRLPDGHPELMGLEPYHYTAASNPYEAFRNVIYKISEQRKKQKLNPVYYINTRYTHSEIGQLVVRADDEQTESILLQQLRLFD